jgi:chromosome partitioning protein
MRTLAFASIKGGVGKTTLAVHVAAALADAGKRTLLVDLDPQGHASMMAGVEMSPEDPCVADSFGARPQKRLADVVQATNRENLWVAPATSRMIEAERELFRWGHRLQAVPRAIASLPYQFDAVVLDTPPQLNAYTEAALATGNVVVVPVPAMAHALQGLDEIQFAWKDVTDGRHSAMIAAVNLWDRRTSATNAAMEDAFREMPVPLAKSRVLRAEALNQAGLAFETVYDYAPSSEVADCLKRLSQELWRLAGKYAN